MNIKKGKVARGELRLPQLYFIVADEWIDKLGEKTFCYWLKLLTLVDRTNEAEKKYGNRSTIPRSFTKIYKRMGISKNSFYRNVIHPLWDYGLIDIEVWEDSYIKGTKPKNIIVYEYPFNTFKLAIQPLEKRRNYKTDYTSDSAKYSRGARKTSSENSVQIGKEDKNTFPNSEPPLVLELEPRSVSENEHNNYTNNIFNKEEEISNTNKSENNSTSDFQRQIQTLIKENFILEELGNFLHGKGVSSENIMKTIKESYTKGLTIFRMEDIKLQYEHMMDKLNYGEVDNHNNFPFYFANGLQMRTEQSILKGKHQQEKQRQYELAMKRKEERQQKNEHIFYDWLNEDENEND
ncbi:hypothetical protein [Virgibacillus sp. DJP39]|uniref:hypothetical protein n=1 Tax=Virgibacillus sp. DJP39 TaxID=3409790 RepID=UPI003BB6107D